MTWICKRCKGAGVLSDGRTMARCPDCNLPHNNPKLRESMAELAAVVTTPVRASETDELQRQVKALAEALRKKEEELLAAYRVIDTARDVLAGRPIPEMGNYILALVCSGPERDALQQAVDAFVALKAAGVEL